MSDRFDPDAAAHPDAGLFGLPHDPEGARVHVLPVPFDATTSYRGGAALGPRAVAAASLQVDLHDLLFGSPWKAGICLLPEDPRIAALQAEALPLAERVIAVGGHVAGETELVRALERVNVLGAELNDLVRAQSERVLDAGKLPVVLGGDHAVPFGAIAAAAARFPGLGVLHFDAHADLREAYEGFTWSHASILHNVLEGVEGVERLVQIGVRDLGERERAAIESSGGRVHTLFDPDWQRARLTGADLGALCREWIARLPDTVWITFDVDGLDPALCPGTGTPVPGGLGWAETMLWLEALAASGKRVVGLDLVEVSPGPGVAADTDDATLGAGWDAIVGARLLYRLIGCAVSTG